ncbi:hypothetical protein SDRG_16342 [Saprolegnia diclina VS20]|uniref:Uncharacterized protein n=1 Tax=Saprolegnia diclina (strain VS20) TaxID=1156394 RepID=T0PK82_SAPDV|nr:hypothetical protein SDRG_16342 [Saprolegnia diclina VS20]EQC25794.1 hypothetical protein SDRG_16342 [Saprolegnia diclina VS20]|eukprot:XP_008620769.1 hypothetical protein SDRG_16342 [Saprolegnia diclina VS20]
MWANVADVQPLILAFAGPLTQLLHGTLDGDQLRSTGGEALKQAIWRDAFRLDLDGDLDMLPPTKLSAADCCCISSKSMYARTKTQLIKTHTIVYERDDALERLLAAAMAHLWIDELDTSDPCALAQTAILGGHMQLLCCLRDDYGVDLAAISHVDDHDSPLAMDWAAGHGYLDVVQLLRDAGCSGCSTEALDDAAFNGHLDVVQWLHRHRTEGGTSSGVDFAIAATHYDIATFLRSHCGLWISDRALYYSASMGSLGGVMYLDQECHASCGADVMDAAAANGHLHIVQYLHTHRSEGCTRKAMDDAASAGHLETVVWLHKHRDEGCTTDAMDAAAERGHLHVVEWLHAT